MPPRQTKRRKGRKSSRNAPALYSVVSRPGEKTHQLRFLPPKKKPEEAGVDGVCLAAGVGFNAPFQVFATPGGEAMASCRIPQKANRHGALSRKVYDRGLSRRRGLET